MEKSLQIFEHERLGKEDVIKYYIKKYPEKTFSIDELEFKANKIFKQFEQYYESEIDRNKSKNKAEIFTVSFCVRLLSDFGRLDCVK